eukprot:966050-Pelagomonas_calceolata.AAC.2
MAPAVKEAITHPLPQPPLPGAILASPGFSLFFGCLCADGGVPPVLANGGTSGGAGSWECPSGDAEGGGGGGGDDTGLVAAVVVVTVVLALLLLGIGGYLLSQCMRASMMASEITLGAPCPCIVQIAFFPMLGPLRRHSANASTHTHTRAHTHTHAFKGILVR